MWALDNNVRENFVNAILYHNYRQFFTSKHFYNPFFISWLVFLWCGLARHGMVVQCVDASLYFFVLIQLQFANLHKSLQTFNHFFLLFCKFWQSRCGKSLLLAHVSYISLHQLWIISTEEDRVFEPTTVKLHGSISGVPVSRVIWVFRDPPVTVYGYANFSWNHKWFGLCKYGLLFLFILLYFFIYLHYNGLQFFF